MIFYLNLPSNGIEKGLFDALWNWLKLLDFCSLFLRRFKGGKLTTDEDGRMAGIHGLKRLPFYITMVYFKDVEVQINKKRILLKDFRKMIWHLFWQTCI